MSYKDEVIAFYESLGIAKENFWIGPEHPQLENKIMSEMKRNKWVKILEIGFQSIVSSISHKSLLKFKIN